MWFAVTSTTCRRTMRDIILEKSLTTCALFDEEESFRASVDRLVEILLHAA